MSVHMAAKMVRALEIAGVAVEEVVLEEQVETMTDMVMEEMAGQSLVDTITEMESNNLNAVSFNLTGSIASSINYTSKADYA